MKSITVISGKGGTGKTTLTAGFAAVAALPSSPFQKLLERRENIVLADCDVDAADLHLLLQPEIKSEHYFEGGKLAYIDPEKCIACGKCVEMCRFDAISDDFVVSPIDCEGCNVCAYVCPVDAITLNIRESGKWFISDTRFGPMVHARLAAGQGNSGRLVSLVRERVEKIALEQNLEYVLIDGPPGIGCPVIAAISGTDLVLIVTEPTLSAMHDMERILGLAEHFQVPAIVCINKYDINLNNTREIERFLWENKITLADKIPFDLAMVRALTEAKTIVEYAPRKRIALIVENIWRKIIDELR
ncbi:TPA: (4Fe-4S)-binding protein [Candidatus Poribacteria bacterium]|nr:(4Fe-4S)-binding protein [Candidatus Poribacteria bacterium]